MKRLLLILTVLNLGSDCLAQQMDTFMLQDFEVKSITGAPKNIGSVKLNLNTGKFNTLADAIQSQSALFVKQYGTGALASTSMRGMGAQHTAVMWNGIYINSCMNSNLDLNLIPFFFIDKATVETGANAAACGNGAIAGAIHLSNTIEKEKQVFLNIQSGSFGYYQAGVGATYKLRKLNLKTRILYRTAENNILFHNQFLPYAPIERQTNSAYIQKGFLQEADVRILKFNAFKLAVWYLESSRQLPPAMGVVNLAHEQQYDMNTRVIINHQYKRSEKLAVNNKMAILCDQLNYYNAYYPAAFSVSKSFITESEWIYRFNHYNRLTNSINNNYSAAKSDGYPNWPTRNMLSYWLKYEWQNRRENLMLSLGSRLLYVDRKFAPFSPDFAFQLSPNKILKIKGNAAYSYRVPSFNDYFWLQGGNKNLLPERGFKQELSAEIKQGPFKMTATVFHHVVNNWIIWIPVNGGNTWTAQNARQVTSSGFEVYSEYSHQIGAHAFQLTGRYQYVESINSKTYKNDEASLNKQLIYTPMHTGSSTLNYTWKKLFYNVTEQFAGSRYTTSDNAPAYKLTSYLLTNTTIGYQLNYKKYKTLLSFTVNNVFNTSYQIMQNRPTPLRNYQITLKFNIINE